MWLLVFLLVLALVFNAVLGFLPNKLQRIRWLRICGAIFTCVVLLYTIYHVIEPYRRRIVAYVSKDGSVLKSNNFPWTITKRTKGEEDIIFIIDGRLGDASEVSIVPDRPIDDYSISNAIDGVCIRFRCSEERIPNFTITIRK